MRRKDVEKREVFFELLFVILDWGCVGKKVGVEGGVINK